MQQRKEAAFVALTVMTYNIHSGKDSDGRMNMDAILDTIASARADLIAVEEVARGVSTAGGLDEKELLGERLGMECVFARAIPYMGGDYGIALLTRLPVSNVTVRPIPDLEPEKRDRWFEHRVILSCDVTFEGREIAFFMTHLGLSEGERGLGVALLRKLAAQAGKPAIAAGDFNTEPEDPLLAPLRPLLWDAHTGLTFPSVRPERKIDYLCASPEWTVLEERVLPSLASDHRALVKKLALAPVPES